MCIRRELVSFATIGFDFLTGKEFMRKKVTVVGAGNVGATQLTGSQTRNWLT